MGDSKSRTEKESSVVERVFDLPPHYKTTIKDGQDEVTRRGSTPEEAEERASKEWDKKKE